MNDVTSTPLLPNFVAGQWVDGQGAGSVLTDPVTGAALARVSSAGLDLPAAFAFAREQGGAALRALSYGERAALLKHVGEVLAAHERVIVVEDDLLLSPHFLRYMNDGLALYAADDAALRAIIKG